MDNACADLIFRYKSDKDVFNNVKFLISGNGVGNISIVNMLSKDSKSFIAIESLATNEVTINLIDLGGSVKIDNYYAELSDEAIKYFNELYGDAILYITNTIEARVNENKKPENG